MRSDRRQFLIDLSTFTSTLCLLPSSMLRRTHSDFRAVALPALPIEITTAIAIAQFALSAAKMFQGTSSSGISSLQIKMLQSISDQLKILQDQISIILSDLEEVKKLLGAIPDQVVRAMNEADLRGAFVQYDELIRTFVREGADIRDFQRKHQTELMTLSQRIVHSRSVLSVADTFLNVPVMSAAAYVEYNTLVMTGEDPNRIAEAMITYRDYFTRVLHKAPNNLLEHIAKIRTDRAALVADATKAYGINAYIPSSWGYGLHFLVIGHSDFNIQLNLTDQAAKVTELLQLGLVNDDERWVTVSRTTVAKGALQNLGASGDWVATTQRPGMFVNQVPITSLPTYQATLDNLNAKQKQLETDVNLKTSQLYAAASSYFAGNRALNFCQQF